MPEYTRKNLTDIFNHIAPETIRRWIEADLFQADREDRNGRGIVRIYDRWNLLQIGIVSELALMFSIRETKDIVHTHFWGKDEVLKKMKMCFGIAIGIGRVFKEFPVLKYCFRTSDKLHEFIKFLMAPTEMKHHPLTNKLFGEDVIPSRIVIINCQEITNKVDFFVKKANVV